MSGRPAALGFCCIHGGLFTFDPDRVPVVLIDPATDRPPDVDEAGNPCEMAPEALARSVRLPYCPACGRRLNDAARARGGAPVFDETDTAEGVRL